MLDWYSRFIVHWDLRENMKESEVSIVQQASLAKTLGVLQRYFR